MPAPRESLLRNCRPLKLDGLTMSAGLYQHTDGRYHIYFSGEHSEISTKKLLGTHARIGYRVWEGGAMFLGMMVPKDMRGQRIGQRLVEYFFDNGMEEDVRPSETAAINKPIIALILQRAGLTPQSEAFQAEILPRSKYDEKYVPKIAIVSNQCSPDMVVDHSDNGKFYDVVSPVDVALRYPIAPENMVVALHTPYQQ